MITLPVIGTPAWGPPLNQALTDLDAQNTVTAGQVTTNLDNLVINVKNHGATGNAVTDDLAAIQAVINNAAAGSIVYFPPGVYRISNSIVLKTGISLLGSHYTAWPGRFPTGLCVIKPTSTFSGECAISILGSDITGSPNNEGNVQITGIDLDGGALPAG